MVKRAHSTHLRTRPLGGNRRRGNHGGKRNSAGQYGWTDEPYETTMQRALAAAERAVELETRDSDAHYVPGVVAWTYGQLLQAEEFFQQCLRLTRSYPPARAFLGLVRGRLGFPADTAVHCERAFALRPREPLRAVWHHFNAVASLALGDSRAALEHVQRDIAANPAYAQHYMTGAAAAQSLGESAQARAWVAVLRERSVFSSLASIRLRFGRTYAPAAMGQSEQLIGLLRDAGMPER